MQDASSSQSIDAFIDALWLEEGLSKNTLLAYRRDLSLFAQWAQATGGTVISAGNLAKWQELVPKREIRQTSVAEVRTLWDTPLALLLVVLLLTAEWAMRRVVRLV